MEKKINLEYVLDSICKDENKVNNSNKLHILMAMRETCRQILELAAENAEITAKLKENCNELSMLDEWTTYIVDKESILNTINQIE